MCGPLFQRTDKPTHSTYVCHPWDSYCRRLQNPSFWGGEPELLVLSKMLRVPIYVYTKEQG